MTEFSEQLCKWPPASQPLWQEARRFPAPDEAIRLYASLPREDLVPRDRIRVGAMPAGVHSNFCLLDLSVRPDRVFVAAMGEEVVARNGYDGTGRFLDEYLDGEKLAWLMESYLRVVSTRRPVLSIVRLTTEGNATVVSWRVLLPVGPPGGDLACIASFHGYEAAEGDARATPRFLLDEGRVDRILADAAETAG
ncbi:MAG TPA: hypothetical protein VEB20_18690 [Azospirillaceae bacterium]|nr:hypothetical protein [Azospirillaceae bacterium]